MISAAVAPASVVLWGKKRALFIGGTLLLIAIVVAGVLWRTYSPPSFSLFTTRVQVGTLARTVNSSGTVNPQNTINIGSQVSGTVSEVEADYNSVVKTGQVLARIDPTQFQTTLDQTLAQLAQTKANAREGAATAVGASAGIDVQRDTANAAVHNVDAAQANAAAARDAIATAQAVGAKAQSALILAQHTMRRDAALVAQGYIAQSAVDADRAGLESAQSGAPARNQQLHRRVRKPSQARSKQIKPLRKANLSLRNLR